MNTNGNGNGSLVKAAIVAVIAALLSAVITVIFTISSGNSKRDTDIVTLQTIVSELKEQISNNHDEDVKSRAEIKTTLEQIEIDVARISQKTGITASPGIR